MIDKCSTLESHSRVDVFWYTKKVVIFIIWHVYSFFFAKIWHVYSEREKTNIISLRYKSLHVAKLWWVKKTIAKKKKTMLNITKAGIFRVEMKNTH